MHLIKEFELAKKALDESKVIAFPTETVYGLGANALDRNAVLSIFAAKGRPADNPLIVHIHSRDQLEPLCRIPDNAFPLMDAFWPGPLTILCHKKPAIPDEVTAGLPTVAVRMPSHPVARTMLQVCNLPVAAPSANSSGRPSPTTAAHVLEDMDGRFEKGGKLYWLRSTVEAFESFLHVPGTVTRKGSHVRDAVDLKRVMIVALAAAIPCALFGMWNVGYQHALATGAAPSFWADFWFGFLKVLPLYVVLDASNCGGILRHFRKGSLRRHRNEYLEPGLGGARIPFLLISCQYDRIRHVDSPAQRRSLDRRGHGSHAAFAGGRRPCRA